MKRVAICYSGQPRDINNTYQNHIKCLYEPLSEMGYEIDVFAHIWFDEKSLGKPFWQDHPLRGKWDQNFKKIFDTKIPTKEILYESPRLFDDYGLEPDPRFPHPLQNTLSMFYSIEAANRIRNQYAKENRIDYEVVIRIRPDLYFLKVLSQLDLTSLDHVNVIFDSNKHMSYAIGDHFAFANSLTMNIYSSIFSNVRSICDNGSAVNPECLLGFNLHLNNILTKTQLLDHILYRDVAKSKKLLSLLAKCLNVIK